jgi:hypothetical protein
MNQLVSFIQTAIAGLAILGMAGLRSAEATDVGVFDNSSFVDTTNGGFLAESDNVQATLVSLGHNVNPFTGITAADFTAAFSANPVVLIPELEVADLNASLTPAARTVIANEVAGGKRLIVHGLNVPDNALLNAVFGLSLTDGAIYGAGELITRTPEAIGTAFAATPLTLAAHSVTWTINTSSLPATYKSIYAIGGDTVVFTDATGNLVYIGWDWFNAAPLGAFSDWNSTLDAAVGTTTVPEPGNLVLASLALLGLLFYRPRIATVDREKLSSSGGHS